MPAWSPLRKHQNRRIREALEGSTFIVPTTSAAITALTGTDKALLALPAGYNDLGWMADDGPQFSSEIDTSAST